MTQGGGAGEPSQDAKRERSREPGKGGEANGWPDEAESARVDFVGSGFSLTGESELASERARRPNASATVVVRTQASWRQRNPDYFIARRIDERDATQAPSPLRVPAPLSKLPWDLAQDQRMVARRAPRLQDRFGMSQQELARRFDKSQSWVSRRLALVRELPTRLQELVREGRLSSHIAMKLLVPMARANADDASRLAEAMARLGLSCRDAYRLHAGFMQSGTRGRELLLEKPELYLRADTEAGRPSSESPSPIEQVTGELDALAGIARRTFRRLEDGRLRRALEPDREHVQRMARVAQRKAQDLFGRIDSELAHAGPEHP